MRIYNRYILALSIAFSLATTLMAAWRVRDITAYFAVYAIIYLVVTTLFVYINPRARRALTGVTFAVLSGFMSVVIIKAMEILSVYKIRY